MTDSHEIEHFSTQLLLKGLSKRLIRKTSSFVRGHPCKKVPVISDKTRMTTYNGISVFDSSPLEGGGTTFGQDYLRCLLTLGFKRCERIYEFCSGPGYIGYSLLANGFCEKLTLSDINPKAVDMARLTASYNHIEHLVNIYLSDCLDQIPGSEHWDLIVGNPPHFLPLDTQARNRITCDPDWTIHKRFYNAVNKFVNPGGFVVLVESCSASNVDIFKPMIQTGGGKFITTILGPSVSGKGRLYYVVSQWL